VLVFGWKGGAMLRQVSSDEGSFSKDRLLLELDDFAQALFGEIAKLEYGLELVRFLSTTSLTLRTCDDIAYRLDAPTASIERDLTALTRLGIVQAIPVDRVVFFQFSADSAFSRVIQDVCAWQDRWGARLQQITHTVFGKHRITDSTIPPAI
jgi:hypothetical protein